MCRLRHFLQEKLACRCGNQHTRRVGIVGHCIGEFGAPQSLIKAGPVEIPSQLLANGLSCPPCIQRTEIGRELGNHQIARVKQHFAHEVEALHCPGRDQDVVDSEAPAGHSRHAPSYRVAKRRKSLHRSIFQGMAPPARQCPVHRFAHKLDRIKLGCRQPTRQTDEILSSTDRQELLGNVVGRLQPTSVARAQLFLILLMRIPPQPLLSPPLNHPADRASAPFRHPASIHLVGANHRPGRL